MEIELFLADLADQLREVRTNDKLAISLVTEVVKGVPEEYRPRVAQLVMDRIRTAPISPVNEVLPSFYVLDCIVKLVGGSFVGLFASELKALFVEAFFRMPDGRTRLCHVLDTWKGVFPDNVLLSIRAALPQAPAALPLLPPAKSAMPNRVIHPAKPVHHPPPPAAQHSTFQGIALAPPEKKLRLDSVIEQQERDIAFQAVQALADLEARIRSQPYGPTQAQLQEQEELRSVLAELQSALPFVPAPVVIPRPVVAQVMPMVSNRMAGPTEVVPVRALDTLYNEKVAGRACPTCALRIRENDLYKEHLDWHFKQNKLASAKVSKVKSRAWFLTASAWHDNSDGTVLNESTPFDEKPKEKPEQEEESGSQKLLVDPSHKSCSICNEPIETVWDDEENDWIYLKASKMPDGSVAHIVCKN